MRSILILLAVLAGSMFAFSQPSPLNSGNRAKSSYQILIEALASAKSAKPAITFYELDPAGGPISNLRDYGFHGWKIIRSSTFEKLNEVQVILDALSREPIEVDQLKQCTFRPKRGIRIQTAEGQIDLSICFSCGYLHAHLNSDDLGLFDIHGSSKALITQAFPIKGGLPQ